MDDNSSATHAILNACASLLDEDVVVRVRRGELALFELLMRRYNQRLYRVARSIVKNDAEAEDLMQQASSTRSRTCDSSRVARGWSRG
jgi:hypothetical protein